METKELKKQVYDKFLLVLVEQARETQVLLQAVNKYADTEIQDHFEMVIKERFYRGVLSIFTQLLKSDNEQNKILALTILEESLIRCGLVTEKEETVFQTLHSVDGVKAFSIGLQFMTEEVWEKINE